MRQLLLIGVLLALSLTTKAELTRSTLFTLNRINFKPEKTLHYDLLFDSESCTINQEKPLDIFYLFEEEVPPRREDMSPDSQKYFGAQWEQENLGERDMEFTTLTIQKFETIAEEDRKYMVEVFETDEGCEPVARIRYGDKLYQLVNISTKVKLFLGWPTGAKWVQLTVINEFGESETLCAAGKCP
jgi:hypothetical protein